MLDLLDRIGRPLTRLAVMVLMVAMVVFFIRFGDATVGGLYRWSEGDGIDMNGLAAVLAAAASMLGVVMPFIVSVFRDRRMERVEEIRARGSPPAAPFGPSGPPPRPPPPQPLPPSPDGPRAGDSA